MRFSKTTINRTTIILHTRASLQQLTSAVWHFLKILWILTHVTMLLFFTSVTCQGITAVVNLSAALYYCDALHRHCYCYIHLIVQTLIISTTFRYNYSYITYRNIFLFFLPYFIHWNVSILFLLKWTIVPNFVPSMYNMFCNDNKTSLSIIAI